MGEQIETTGRSEDGTERVWTLSKKQVELEPLPDRALPKPAPRETDPDQHTESARTLDAMALEALNAGDVARGFELFEQAIAADPDDWVPRSNYGRMLVLVTDYQEAQTQLERAAELRPDDPQMWLDLQTLYERSVRLERSWAARRRAQELAGDRSISKDDRGFYFLEGNELP
jgi:predicted Zn-dependent protease